MEKEYELNVLSLYIFKIDPLLGTWKPIAIISEFALMNDSQLQVSEKIKTFESKFPLNSEITPKNGLTSKSIRK